MSYVLDEGCLFEKSGTNYIIGGIRFVLTVGEVYCADGVISPDNCVDAKGDKVDTSDVTEDQAKAHLDWMDSDFESRGVGVVGETIIEKVIAYTNKGPIYVPLTDATSVVVETDEKTETVTVESVVAVIDEVVTKSNANTVVEEVAVK